MNVLAVASEIYPLVKTGGLGDVVGALPLALKNEGIAVRTLIPGYPAVMKVVGRKKPAHIFPSLFGGKAALLQAKVEGLELIVLDAPHLFDRAGGPYGDATGTDYPDNWQRFAALGRAAAAVAEGALKDFRPDVMHAHDWQAALAPAYLRHGPASMMPAVMTIHNLAFQGQFAASIFPGLGLPETALALDGVEYYGGVGYLKAGMQYANAITTVSPTYAEEIKTPAFGMGLDGLIRARAGDLHGIVNGIDIDVWNPATDSSLATPYPAKTLKAREKNKRAVEARFQLDPSDSPIFCVVSRLTWQKGMDLLVEVLDGLVATGARLVVLGSGDSALEGALLAGAARHRGRIGAVIGYDERLSHLMQGGADAILIPSRFEPCGLTQLYGLRYGCVPVVARTGGLADTVIDANEAAVSAGVATGLQHEPGSADGLYRAVERAVILHAKPAVWQSMQKQGMKADVSWAKSARKYAELYRALVKRGSP